MKLELKNEIEVLKSIIDGIENGDTVLRFSIESDIDQHAKSTWNRWYFSDHVSIGTGEFRRLSKFNDEQQKQFKKHGYIVTGSKLAT